MNRLGFLEDKSLDPSRFSYSPAVVRGVARGIENRGRRSGRAVGALRLGHFGCVVG